MRFIIVSFGVFWAFDYVVLSKKLQILANRYVAVYGYCDDNGGEMDLKRYFTNWVDGGNTMELVKNISIVLADDHEIIREGLVTLIEKEPGIEVVAQASTGTDVVSLAETFAPDVVVMDVNMPLMDGIEASRRILEKNPNIKILILSAVLTRHIIDQAIGAGVFGIMKKESAFRELCDAIYAVNAGERYFCAKIMDVVANSYVGRICHLEDQFESLTERESEVVRQFSKGKSSKEIAIAIDISGKTVDAYRRRIMEKMWVNSTADLVKYAIRNGLTNL